MELLKTGLSTFGLGFGTVFVGLICLIVIIKLMSVITNAGKKKPSTATQAATSAAAAEQAPVSAEISDREQFIAAVSAAIATVMGTDVTGLRIVSVKKVNH